jgi:hypothetical protein
MRKSLQLALARQNERNAGREMMLGIGSDDSYSQKFFSEKLRKALAVSHIQAVLWSGRGAKFAR